MPERQQQIIVTIDGFSSCGKSTLARDLAEKLNYIHVDSGAMYRAITLYMIRHNVDIGDHEAVEKALPFINVTMRYLSDGAHTYLNGEDVESEIRTIKVNHHVSPVSAISSVRRTLVAQQRQLGAQSGIVMDGRDIGTVVFPDAQLKLFLTASLDVRIDRRYHELALKGIPATRDEVSKSITERDEIDSTREDSPLRKADDAIIIDNTELTREEQLEVAYQLALERIEGHAKADPN